MSVDPVTEPPEAAIPEVGTVGVVGVGLIGGSIVRACLTAGVPVLVVDLDPEAVRQACEAGAVPADLGRLRSEADIVFLCAPPAVVAELWERWLALPGPGERGASRSLVLDVSSVKAPVVSGMEARGLPVEGAGTAFVLSHPMAGRERSGWSAGEPGLFDGATWVLTPPASVTGRELLRCTRTVETFGATACFMERGFHDRFAAVTSHVPHVLAFAYQRIVDEVDTTGWRRFSGNSLNDVLRLSSSNPTLWTEILSGNAAQLAPLLRNLADRLEDFDPATDVTKGQPRPPRRAATAATRESLALAAPIGERLPDLLATGEKGLHLDRWAVDVAGQVVELTFARR